MIIIRTPYRIPLVGGGTDLDFYYKKKGGLLISGTFNQYIFVSLFESSQDNKISSQVLNTELTKDIKIIKNKIFKETLKFFKIKKSFRIGTFSTLPKGSGLGSSSSLTVGLVNGIYRLFKKKKSKKKIAMIAFNIERKKLNFKGGWQDQIMASYGGINKIKINKNGKFRVSKLDLRRSIIQKIERHFFLIYSGITRNSSKIIKSQIKNKKKTIKIYDRIKVLVYEFEKALKKGNIYKIGKIFNEQWFLKKQISKEISSSSINKFYQNLLKEKSFVGGKLIGAGGGGFFLMVSKNSKKTQNYLKRKKINFLKIRFTNSGSSQIVNTANYKT